MSIVEVGRPGESAPIERRHCARRGAVATAGRGCGATPRGSVQTSGSRGGPPHRESTEGVLHVGRDTATLANELPMEGATSTARRRQEQQVRELRPTLDTGILEQALERAITNSKRTKANVSCHVSILCKPCSATGRCSKPGQDTLDLRTGIVQRVGNLAMESRVNRLTDALSAVGTKDLLAICLSLSLAGVWAAITTACARGAYARRER